MSLYSTLATSKTPALIIYLLDVSASMSQPLGKYRRIDFVTTVLNEVLQTMVFRCTKGRRISPRYHLAMYAYTDTVYDLLDGIKPITEVAELGAPLLDPMRTTDTAKAFTKVENLLQSELPKMQDCPAPIVCHLTDGENTGDDPAPVIRRIMQMSVPDGNILVENIFISDGLLPEPIKDVKSWGGVLPNTKLGSKYAEKLRDLSSPLPKAYHEMMQEMGYRLNHNALMLLPAENTDLVRLGIQMSGATPISKSK